MLTLLYCLLFIFMKCNTSAIIRKVPRLDEIPTSKTYQIVKIAEDRGFYPVSDSSHYQNDKWVFNQTTIIKGIDQYKKRYAKPDSYYSWPNQIDPFLKDKYNPKKLEEVIKYFKKAKEPYIFNVHRRNITQYSFEMLDWSDKNDNLVISDFFGRYTETARTYLLFFLEWIPSYTVGTGIYSLTINGETIEFSATVLKEFSIFPFSKKYWGYASLFSTKNGKDQAPLLIRMSDPNDRENSQNGFYLLLPKESE
jgi:hypothetical protein